MLHNGDYLLGAMKQQFVGEVSRLPPKPEVLADRKASKLTPSQLETHKRKMLEIKREEHKVVFPTSSAHEKVSSLLSKLGDLADLCATKQTLLLSS